MLKKDKYKPFKVPTFVRKNIEGAQEVIWLAEVSKEDLEYLCKEFTKSVMQEAGK